MTPERTRNRHECDQQGGCVGCAEIDGRWASIAGNGKLFGAMIPLPAFTGNVHSLRPDRTVMQTDDAWRGGRPTVGHGSFRSIRASCLRKARSPRRDLNGDPWIPCDSCGHLNCVSTGHVGSICELIVQSRLELSFHYWQHFSSNPPPARSITACPTPSRT